MLVHSVGQWGCGVVGGNDRDQPDAGAADVAAVAATGGTLTKRSASKVS